jgi:hypothetical protein
MGTDPRSSVRRHCSAALRRVVGSDLRPSSDGWWGQTFVRQPRVVGSDPRSSATGGGVFVCQPSVVGSDPCSSVRRHCARPRASVVGSDLRLSGHGWWGQTFSRRATGHGVRPSFVGWPSLREAPRFGGRVKPSLVGPPVRGQTFVHWFAVTARGTALRWWGQTFARPSGDGWWGQGGGVRAVGSDLCSSVRRHCARHRASMVGSDLRLSGDGWWCRSPSLREAPSFEPRNSQRLYGSRLYAYRGFFPRQLREAL